MGSGLLSSKTSSSKQYFYCHCHCFTVQQGKETCTSNLGVWNHHGRVQTCARIFYCSRQERRGDASPHNRAMSSPWKWSSYTDDWGAYRGLVNLPNVRRHRIVVHARHFVDPRTGVHTQEVESCWSKLKLGLKRRKGIRRHDLQSYLDEVMWRQWRGGDHAQIMANFISIIPQQFNVNDPVLWDSGTLKYETNIYCCCR